MIKTLIFGILILGTTTAMAAGLNCSFESDGENGQVNVVISGSEADLNLSYNGKKEVHKKCKVSKDDFGQLVDCTVLDKDLMVLVNEESGGIMSSALDLYVDLDC